MAKMNLFHCYCLSCVLLYLFLSSEARVFFLPEKQEQIVAAGDAINITCIYQGDAIPTEEMHIKREDGQVLKDFEFVRRGSTSPPWNKTTTGFKKNASCEDEGNYICSFENEKTIQKISLIKVFFLPDKPEQTVEEGAPINITCVYQGCAIPKQEMHIQRDGHDLKDFKFMRWNSSSAPWNKTTTGLKTNASFGDEGNYTCSFENDMKSQKISVIKEKRHREPTTEESTGISSSVIIASAVAGVILIIVAIIIILVYFRRKGLCKSNAQETGTHHNNAEGIPLQLESSDNRPNSANEPLLECKTNDTAKPPPKPPRTHHNNAEGIPLQLESSDNQSDQIYETMQ